MLRASSYPLADGTPVFALSKVPYLQMDGTFRVALRTETVYGFNALLGYRYALPAEELLSPALVLFQKFFLSQQGFFFLERLPLV